MAKSIEEIAKLEQNTHFRRRFLGGVDEDDAWLKLEHLHHEYVELIRIERQRAQDILTQWERYADSLEERIRQLEAKSSPKITDINDVHKSNPGDDSE